MIGLNDDIAVNVNGATVITGRIEISFADGLQDSSLIIPPVVLTEIVS